MSNDEKSGRLNKKVLREDQGRNSSVKPAKEKRYSWPPPPGPDVDYIPKQRNPIHSLLTALPVIMLLAGLYLFYFKESEQANSAPIYSESVEATGIFTGLSIVNSGGQGRHYLWFEENGSTRGVRFKPEQAQLLKVLNRDEKIYMKIAPTVHGSKTYWVWYVEQSGKVLLNLKE